MKIGKIEKDVKVPRIHSRSNYPWPDMEVDDSVFIKTDSSKILTDLQNNINSATYYYSKKTGKKFKSMMVRKDNGVRVWRLE